MYISILNQLKGQQAKTSESLKHEIRLIVDNDVFTSAFRDQYYTSGIFGSFRWLTNIHDSTRRSVNYLSLTQRIFTPQNVTWDSPERFDRPYAGQLSVKVGRDFYWIRSHLKTEVELGWMGPSSQTGAIQVFWHDVLGLPSPSGWDYEVGNSPIINYFTTYAYALLQTAAFDIISESNLSLGTAFSHLRQEFVFRLGKLKPVGQSVHYNGVIGGKMQNLPKGETRETYLFYAPGYEYVFFNSTIEGNLFGGNNPHTMQAVPGVFQHRAGIISSWNTFDIVFIYYYRTKETYRAVPHQYGGLHLNYRF